MHTVVRRFSRLNGKIQSIVAQIQVGFPGLRSRDSLFATTVRCPFQFCRARQRCPSNLISYCHSLRSESSVTGLAYIGSMKPTFPADKALSPLILLSSSSLTVERCRMGMPGCNRRQPQIIENRTKTGALHLRGVVYRPDTLCNVFHPNLETERSGHREDIFASCTFPDVHSELPISGTGAG